MSAKVNTVVTKLLISLEFGTYTPNVSNGYKISTDFLFLDSFIRLLVSSLAFS